MTSQKLDKSDKKSTKTDLSVGTGLQDIRGTGREGCIIPPCSERFPCPRPVRDPSLSSLKAATERPKAPVCSLSRGFFISWKLQEMRDCFASNNCGISVFAIATLREHQLKWRKIVD